MHGGAGTPKRMYRAGRGFGARPFLGTPEPANAPTTEDDQPASAPAWGEVHGALLADYEQRLAAHEKQAAQMGRSAERGAYWTWAQRQQAMSSGSMGFKGFFNNRTELTGTPAYDRDFLKLDRPAVSEGIGPTNNDRIGKLVQRRTSQRALANQGAALEAEGTALAMLRGDDDEAADASPMPPPSGESSPWPRGGPLPKGTQLAGFVGRRLPGYSD